MRKQKNRRTLFEIAAKLREEKRQNNELKLKELQSVTLKRYPNGEYIPLNCDDIDLREWCFKFNRKLRKYRAVIEQTIIPIRKCGIQPTLLKYYPHDNNDKLLCEWCRNKNRENQTLHTLSKPIKEPIIMVDGKYKAVDGNDALLVQWCEKYNRKLLQCKRFVEKYASLNAPYPFSLRGDFYEVNDNKQVILKRWCERRNAEIKKLLSERRCFDDKA